MWHKCGLPGVFVDVHFGDMYGSRKLISLKDEETGRPMHDHKLPELNMKSNKCMFGTYVWCRIASVNAVQAG